MSVASTMLRCVASAGGSLTKTRSGRPDPADHAIRSIARPVVPLWAPTTATDSARAPARAAPRVSESQAGEIASGVAGSVDAISNPPPLATPNSCARAGRPLYYTHAGIPEGTP